jgi:hypothetical protein
MDVIGHQAAANQCPERAQRRLRSLELNGPPHEVIRTTFYLFPPNIVKKPLPTLTLEIALDLATTL